MPTFKYQAKKGPHQLVEGKVDASSEDEAIRKVDGLGLIPVRIKIAQGTAEGQTPTARGRRPLLLRAKKKEIILFTRNLANLLKGNIPILRGLKLLAKQSKGDMGRVVNDLHDSVRDGLSLSQATEKYPNVFSPLWTSMVRGGEAGGVLTEMMEKLSLHMEKEEDIRRKVRGALAYPLFMLAMGIFTVGILLTYFMPRLLTVYIRNKQDLPWPTEVVMGSSQFLSGYWYWIVGVLILVYAFVYRLSNPSSRQIFIDGIKLRLPFIKQLVLKNSVMHFARTLWLLLAHGVPLVKGVPLAVATMQNQVIANTFKEVEGDLVTKGATLAAALKKVSYFPSMALDMVQVGEESGQLALSLSHLADTYEKEMEEVLKTLTQLLEPLLILIIGSIIGFIVFAMLLPVFDIDVMM